MAHLYVEKQNYCKNHFRSVTNGIIYGGVMYKKLMMSGLLSVSACIPVSVHAYTYNFNNESDLAAEVQFKLAADITTASSHVQKVTVPAHSSNSITIPDWNRKFLCIDLYSIEVKFLPDGTLKKPYVESKNIDFAHIVKTHKMPERFMQSGGKGLIGGRLMDYTPENLLKYADDLGMWKQGGVHIVILCGDQTFDFTYHEVNKYPVMRYR